MVDMPPDGAPLRLGYLLDYDLIHQFQQYSAIRGTASHILHFGKLTFPKELKW